MRIFKSFPKENNCLVCGKNTDKECILVPIIDSIDNNVAIAEPVHLDCLSLVYDKYYKFIYMSLSGKGLNSR